MNTTLNQNRSLNLFIVVGITVALIAAIVISSPAAVEVPTVPQYAAEDQSQNAFAPLSADAFPEYRQSEWGLAVVPVTGDSGMETYHLSERTMVDPNAGLAIYNLSEHTLTDPQAGVQTYLASERTSVPVRFTQYQLSEWFGK